MTPVNKERVKDLFEIPQSVHKIGFVEELTRASREPKRTSESYVVTPALLGAFDAALGLVGTALREGRSHAAFLQGSFGSGKSHFMALVSLLLEGDEYAWRIPELHVLRTKHAFAGKEKLLPIRLHFVGHTGNIESNLFQGYISTVRERHPGADLPGVFADEKLFADASHMLEELGDERFFAPMNVGKKAADEWGTIGAADFWTRERFDEAARSSEPSKREALFNALVKTRFGAFADESRQFVDLDEGLATLSRHAKGLGYAGILLYLDELILWLASRASDVTWFHKEVQKVVKLVEAQESRRDVPIVSFIARQRDLAEMVGRDYAGLESTLVRDSLNWSKGRFDTIFLEDKNLPAIAEKRILRPKNEEARAKLDAAFKAMRAKLGDSAWQLLVGELDEKDFRRLYPFSPALMDALVALSTSLQRNRTAIRLLTELLVEHIEDLGVGEVVRVGDLFDVIAGGDDSTDGVMRARFESAKQLYAYQFLPVIQQTNATNTAEKCQRLRPDHPARIGCSNCPQSACRADNRLVKTLLIAALVSERPALKDLTANRLVQLNHGSLNLPIPGTDAMVVTQKLRNWASSGTIAQLHVGNQADPSVRIQLEGVDTAPILEAARQYDQPGARQRVLRDLLFESLQIEKIQDWGKDHPIENWRGTKRIGHIRFGNVRKMTPEQLLCGEEHDWRLVVDYPFDEEGFGPRDDEKILETFLQTNTHGTWTLVWLPTFLSKDLQRMLGDLVVLEHILSDNGTTRQYVSHLSIENQQRASNDLQNLKTQKQARLQQVLEQAYGLAKPREEDLDFSSAPEKHLVVLKPGAQVRPQLAATLADAVDHYIPELLASRYPNHPKFTKKLTKLTVEDLVARFGEIVDTEDKKIPVDRERADVMRNFLVELGLVRVTESTAFLRDDDILQRLENVRMKKALDRPTVGDVRSWMDDGTRGLQPDVLDLLLRCYARWSARTLIDRDLPYEAKAGHVIPAYVALERPDLPTQTTWTAALARAGDYGVTLAGRALHGDNLKRFEADLTKFMKSVQVGAARLVPLLERRLAQFGVEGEVDRLISARSADLLLRTLADQKGKALVESLAAYEPRTSGRAVASSVAGAANAVSALDDDLVFGPLEQLRGRDDLAGGAELLERLTQALRQDELNVALGAKVRELAKEALKLIKPKDDVRPVPPNMLVAAFPVSGHTKGEARAAIEKLARDVEQALTDAGDDIELSGAVRLVWRKKS